MPRPSVLRRAALLIAALSVAACRRDEPMSPGPGTATIVSFSSSASVSAELAATAMARTNGLMNRSSASLGANAGMLFVYAADQPVGPLAPGFWMKNTLFDLSIAFLDSAKRVIETRDMVALDTITLHRPAVPYRYALEVHRGWFAAHGVAAGAVAAFTLPAGTIIEP